VKLKELRIGSGATIIISGSLLGIANRGEEEALLQDIFLCFNA